MSLREQVRDFHEAFGQPVLGRPTVPSEERRMLRVRLVDEEVREFKDAIGYRSHNNGDEEWMSRCDLVETVDAIADAMYVLMGSALEHGVDMGPVLAEVHRANMAKLWPDGTVHYDANGKVLKPPGWTPPDIAGVLRAQGWEAPE